MVTIFIYVIVDKGLNNMNINKSTNFTSSLDNSNMILMNTEGEREEKGFVFSPPQSCIRLHSLKEIKGHRHEYLLGLDLGPRASILLENKWLI